jgi:hypothetical protein
LEATAHPMSKFIKLSGLYNWLFILSVCTDWHTESGLVLHLLGTWVWTEAVTCQRKSSGSSRLAVCRVNMH